MSKYESLQKIFFDEIRNHLPDHISLVNQIAETLNVSTDSAYRRIRGQKQLSLEEMEKLVKRFDVSIDALILNSKKVIACRYNIQDNELDPIEQHLQNFQNVLININRFPEKNIFFEAKDLPIPNLLLVPEIFAFKKFFWCKVIYNHETYQDKKFSEEMVNENLKAYCRKTLAELVKIPSVEIWNIHTLDTLINQIRYCSENKYFKNKKALRHLINNLFQWQSLFKEQCSLGYRSIPGTKIKGRMESFILYCTDIIFPTNNILIRKNGYKSVYLVQHDVSMIQTDNQEFCNQMHDWMQNCKSKSDQIHLRNSKKFKIFFDTLNQKLKTLSKEVGI